MTFRRGRAGSSSSCTTSPCGSRPVRCWSTRRAGRAPRSSTPTSCSRWSARTPGCYCPPRPSRAGRRRWPGRTAATPCGSGRRPRSGCSPPACAAGRGSGGRWRRRTGTRPAGRCCPGPGSSCGASVTGSTWSPTWRSTSGSGSTGPCTGAPSCASSRPAWTPTSITQASTGARCADAALLIVGGGPYGKTLRRLAGDLPVIFTGSVPWPELPAHYAAGDVYAMPCRTRRGGLDVEGFGIVFLEASATGLPVVAGDSGGSPDAVRDGETGYLVDGHDLDALAGRLVKLLTDRDLARRLGAAGRAWVEERWRWDTQADRMAALLAGTDPP